MLLLYNLGVLLLMIPEASAFRTSGRHGGVQIGELVKDGLNFSGKGTLFMHVIWLPLVFYFIYLFF